MRRTIELFILAKDGRPGPAGTIEVEGNDIDALERGARAVLTTRFRHLRTLSFTPAGMVAYVEGPLS